MGRDYEATVCELVAGMGDWFDRQPAPRLTQELYPYTHLFSPIQVNALKLKNRLVMGPMGNICLADEMGQPSNKMVQLMPRVSRATLHVSRFTFHASPTRNLSAPEVACPTSQPFCLATASPTLSSSPRAR